MNRKIHREALDHFKNFRISEGLTIMLTKGDHTDEKIQFYSNNENIIFPYWDKHIIIYKTIELKLHSNENLDFIDKLFFYKENKSIYNVESIIHMLLKIENLDAEVIDHIITKSFYNLRHHEKDKLLNFYLFNLCADMSLESLIEKVLIKTSEIVGYLYENKSPQLISMISYGLIDINTLEKCLQSNLNWNEIIHLIFKSGSYKKEIYEQLPNILNKYDVNLSDITTKGNVKKRYLTMLLRDDNIKKVLLP